MKRGKRGNEKKRQFFNELNCHERVFSFVTVFLCDFLEVSAYNEKKKTFRKKFSFFCLYSRSDLRIMNIVMLNGMKNK